MDFCKLRNLREINHISLAEASIEIGLSDGYLSRLERGMVPKKLKPELVDKFNSYCATLKLRAQERVADL